MIYLKTIILCFAVMVSCTQQDSKKESKSLISENTKSTIAEQCAPLEKRFEELCPSSRASKCSIQNPETVKKAFALLEDLPELSTQKREAYKKFLTKKDITKKDINEVFGLLGLRCKKATRYNLWKALTVNAELAEKKYINEVFKKRVLDNYGAPSNVFDLMIYSLILKFGVVSDVVSSKSGAMDRLEAIRNELSNEHKNHQGAAEEVFQPLAESDSSKVSGVDFDPKKVQAHLAEEAKLVNEYYERMKAWSKENIL